MDTALKIREPQIDGEEGTFLASVESYIDQAFEHLDLSEGLAERIRACNSTYTVRFGVRLRGRMYSFTGWRSVPESLPDYPPPPTSISTTCLDRFRNA